MIQQIANNESGSSVRGKLNEVITSVNGVPPLTDVVIGQNGINTIGQALQYLTQLKNVYQPNIGNIRATITVNSNFTMNETIAVNGQNYGWIELRVLSESTLTVANTQPNTITEYQPGDTYRAGFFATNGGVLPVLSGSFILDDDNADALIGLYGPGSTCILRDRDTVIDGDNKGGNVIGCAYGGKFVARNCTLRNSGSAGNVLNVTNMSEAIINDCIVSGGGNYDINAVRGSRAIVHRSTFENTNTDTSSEIYISN